MLTLTLTLILTIISLQEIVNLEAWKGDVTAVNQSTFNVQSKCYNSKLYACQVSFICYILRIQWDTFSWSWPSRCYPLGMSCGTSLTATLMQQSTSMGSWSRSARRSAPTWACLRRLSPVNFGLSWITWPWRMMGRPPLWPLPPPTQCSVSTRTIRPTPLSYVSSGATSQLTRWDLIFWQYRVSQMSHSVPVFVCPSMSCVCLWYNWIYHSIFIPSLCNLQGLSGAS